MRTRGPSIGRVPGNRTVLTMQWAALHAAGKGGRKHPGSGPSSQAMERLREFLRARLEKLLAPVARLLQRLDVSPNQVSITGALLSVAAAALIVADHLVWAGVVYLAAGALDMLDGMLARLADRASRFGAFLDSTLDRISEGVVLTAAAYHFALGGRPIAAGLVVLALLGSLLVSYTRARAEGLGAQCKTGIVTRAERVVLIAFALLSGLLFYVILVLVALTGFTVGQRILLAFRELAPQREIHEN